MKINNSALLLASLGALASCGAGKPIYTGNPGLRSLQKNNGNGGGGNKKPNGNGGGNSGGNGSKPNNGNGGNGGGNESKPNNGNSGGNGGGNSGGNGSKLNNGNGGNGGGNGNGGNNSDDNENLSPVSVPTSDAPVVPTTAPTFPEGPCEDTWLCRNNDLYHFPRKYTLCKVIGDGRIETICVPETSAHFNKIRFPLNYCGVCTAAPTSAPTLAPITPAPVTPAPVTPAPVTPAPVPPAPVTPAPVTPAPTLATPAPIVPDPVTPAPVAPAPAPTLATPAPVVSAPTDPVPEISNGEAFIPADFIPNSPDSIGDIVDTVQDAITSSNSSIPGGCFSGDNIVMVENYGNHYPVHMKDLQIGDRVQVSKEKYEPIYSFAHNHPDSKGQYIQVNNKITLTNSHMIAVKDRGFIPASMLEIGNVVFADGDKSQEERVSKIEKRTAKGLHAPLTPSSTIVVSGYLTSCYVSLQVKATSVDLVQIQGLSTGLSFHFLSAIAQLPHRVACYHFAYCPDEHYDENGISTWMTKPKALFEYVAAQANPVLAAMMMIILIPLFCILGLGYATEQLLVGNETVFWSTAVLVVIRCLLSRRRRKMKQL